MRRRVVDVVVPVSDHAAARAARIATARAAARVIACDVELPAARTVADAREEPSHLPAEPRVLVRRPSAVVAPLRLHAARRTGNLS